MGKIRGWSIGRNYPPYEFSWDNPKKPTRLYVQKPGGVEFWTVYTNFINSNREEDFNDFGRFKTKKEALNYASAYMRSHPYG